MGTSGRAMSQRLAAAARRVGLSLAIGVAATVLSAWVMSCVPPGGYGPFTVTIESSGPNGLWLVRSSSASWFTTRSSEMLTSPESYGIAGGAFALTLGGSRAEGGVRLLEPGQTLAELDPELASSVAAGAPPGAVATWPLREATGWPMRALAKWHANTVVFGSATSVFAPGSRVVRGVVLRGESGPMALDGIALPYWPLWPGFAVNTVLFGAIVGAAMWAGTELRQRRRRARGACAACGYDAIGLGRCPECGTENTGGVVAVGAAPADGATDAGAWARL